jgi:hypothetical protein
MTIRSLFDPSKDIYRTIEKVITYGASQEGRLKAEISEYVVTESIEEQFRKLLDRMQLAMESGGENEIGVWVSGFYGSGKSSFTKYLGLAFDDQRTIDGTPSSSTCKTACTSRRPKRSWVPWRSASRRPWSCSTWPAKCSPVPRWKTSPPSCTSRCCSGQATPQPQGCRLRADGRKGRPHARVA